MANTLLTPDMITDEALMILHQKANFIGNCNRQYDDRFARDGAKIGDTLRVRLPVKYTTRSGATLSAQNTTERKVSLPVATQIGVDMNFSSSDLTMKIQDFSERYIKPAISQLAATLDNQMMTLAYTQVGNYQGIGTMSFDSMSQCQQILAENLAPPDPRAFTLTPYSQRHFITDTKSLFQSSDNIKEQYREGMLGRTAGFDVYENTLNPNHTVGTYSGTPRSGSSSVTTTQGNAGTGNAWVETSDIVTDGWTSTTLNAGDIITFDGVFAVHPETKQNLGYLQRFSVTEQVSDTAGDLTMTLRPGVIYGGAYKNVTNGIANDTTINVVGTTGQVLRQDFAFHRDAFIFASVDLEDVSQYGAWGSRRRFENISMRIARQYDINNDNVPCRIDILWGGCASYPELAVRKLSAV